jgi:hypothetical protein
MNMQLKTRTNNQDGLVALVVVTTIVVILALVTIGFAKIMDREYRQSVDRDLSSQADYAAASALNDARAYANNLNAQNLDPSTGGQCLKLSKSNIFPHNGTVGSVSGDFTRDPNDNTVKYTCIIIDGTPHELIYNVTAGDSVIFKVTPGNPPNSNNNLSKLFISWENKTYPLIGDSIQPKGLSIIPSFPREDQYNSDTNGSGTGMVKVNLYPVPLDSSTQNASQQDNLETISGDYFLYPNTSTIGAGKIGNITYSTNGGIDPGNCDNGNRKRRPGLLPWPRYTPRFCNSSISAMPSAGSSTPYEYYVELTALYQTLSISIQGLDKSGNSIAFPSTQAVIDVTSSGNDILRRVQSRVAYKPQTFSPGFTVQSLDTLCKRFKVPFGKGGINDRMPTVIEDPNLADPNIIENCQPQQ